jgi:hypothetical protein
MDEVSAHGPTGVRVGALRLEEIDLRMWSEDELGTGLQDPSEAIANPATGLRRSFDDESISG